MPADCIVRIGPQLRRELDEYLEFGAALHHKKLDANEAATVILWNFLETEEQFLG